MGGNARETGPNVAYPMKRLDSYIWIACSAAWLVLAWVAGSPEAAMTGLWCGVLAYWWQTTFDKP